MKLSITEVRDLVAETLRKTIIEAKKKGKKIPAQRSEESIKAQKERRLKGTGYTDGGDLDFSEPLGDASVVKKQGASGIGNWTRGAGNVKAENYIRALIRMVVAEEIRAISKK